MTPRISDLWVYLAASPLLGLTVTLLAYQGGLWLYRRSGMHPLANPVLLAVAEYTMIGQPITDLYRLESVAKSNAINFFGNSSYDNLGFQLSIFDQSAVYCRGFNISDLQGIDFTQVKYSQISKIFVIQNKWKIF